MKNDRLRAHLVISLASIVLTLGALESYARLVLNIEPQLERFLLHPDMGWEWTPGYVATENIAGTDYLLEISRQGLPHAPVYEIPKPTGRLRVLALGDSITQGPGVEPQDTFAQRLQQALRAKYPALEVINGGTGDYGGEQELAWLRARGMRYEPDLVILTVYLNDSRPPKRINAIVAAQYNFLISRSAAYYYFVQRVRGAMIEQEIARPNFRFRFGRQFDERAWIHDQAALTQVIQDADQDWGLAWTEAGLEQLKSNLADLITFARSNDLPLLINITPVAVQVYADVDTPLDLNRPQTDLVAFAQVQGAPVLDLLPILRERRGEDLFFDQCHFRANAHAIVAEALAQAVFEHHLLP